MMVLTYLSSLICFIITVALTYYRFFHMHRSISKKTTIPGPNKSDLKNGNLMDIRAAGGLHQYLKILHDKYGEITSLWFGETFCVSIANTDLWKTQLKAFNRPCQLFMFLEPLLTKYSMQLTNQDEGKKRRHTTDVAFGHGMLHNYYGIFHEIIDHYCDTLSCLPDGEQIALSNNMMVLSLKGVTRTSFGDYFKDDENAFKFKAHYDQCWSYFDNGLVMDPSSESVAQFNIARDAIHRTIQHIINERRQRPPPEDEQVYLDILIGYALSDDQILADAVTYVIGGLHSSGMGMSWCIYYLAIHNDIQDKVFNEIKAVLGNEKVTQATIKQLVYTKQVLDETARVSILASITARYQDIDIEIGGHVVPKMTPVIHAIGVVHQDEKYWPEPTKFDPDRFSAENKRTRNSLSFSPFGFAGKRMCPGHRFFYAEATVFLTELIRKFKFKLVNGDSVKPIYGLITNPSEEIWVTIQKR